MTRTASAETVSPLLLCRRAGFCHLRPKWSVQVDLLGANMHEARDSSAETASSQPTGKAEVGLSSASPSLSRDSRGKSNVIELECLELEVMLGQIFHAPQACQDALHQAGSPLVSMSGHPSLPASRNCANGSAHRPGCRLIREHTA
jgi:hypothetical protein